MKPSLANLLNRQAIRRLTDARSWSRGEDYFDNGHVGAVAEHRGTITARVQGTELYRIKLWIEDDALEYSCTCPVGRDGLFCKHCVAVGLTWLEGAPAKSSVKKRAKPAVTMDDVRVWLSKQEKTALVDMLLEQALEDDRLRQRLFLKAARKDSGGFNLDAYRQAIDDAVNTGEFVDYHAAYDYARGIEETIDAVEELLGKGHAAEVIELTEHALHVVEKALGYVDDSNGEVGGILNRLQEIHHKACRKAKPDPEALARRLFEWELGGEWDTFYGASATYADVLGKRGLTIYRELAEAAWAKVPALGPGRDDPENYGRRYRITHIMETLARQSGDTEALVAIKQRDLSSAFDYLEIAEIYKNARKHDKALEWAERGMKAFPNGTDSRLREFLAAEYHRRKRHDEAMALIWSEFEESPSLQQYQNLRSHADRIAQWPVWREKALEYLRKSMAQAKRGGRKQEWGWYGQTDNSELVRIFLWEKDAEAAWREAQAGGCSNELWMKLAAEREKAHPEDALPIYQRQIDTIVGRKNNEAYREAVELLRKIRRLLLRLDRESDFSRYLESIRVTHKPKRNFMKMLSRARW